MTLYLKYRPQTISELDLTSVRNSFEFLLKSENIPHAFLFAGPRGTGKTSAARILAKVLNCEKNKESLDEPCNKCEQCLAISNGQHMDVIELDAASHRGIDDIRSLRQSVSLSPSQGRKKVYILDEAHMLTLEAANAFLKTLEEPPEHVVFILATTDPQKLPITVRSRLSLIQFSRATDEEIKRQLQRVKKGEGLKISDEALGLITSAADGSFRDAVKIVESLVLRGKEIDKDSIDQVLGSFSNLETSNFFRFLQNKDASGALKWLSGYVKNGGDCGLLIGQIISSLRSELLSLNGLGEQRYEFGSKDIMALLEIWLKAQEQMRFSPVDSLPAEIAVVKYCSLVTSGNLQSNLSLEKRNSTILSKKIDKDDKDMQKNGHVKETKLNGGFDESVWHKVVAQSRNNLTIEALLRAANPVGYDGERLQIGVYYRFHKEQLEVQKNRLALEQIIADVTGKTVKVDYCLVERKNVPIKKDPPLTSTKDDDIIEAAKEIFS